MSLSHGKERRSLFSGAPSASAASTPSTVPASSSSFPSSYSSSSSPRVNHNGSAQEGDDDIDLIVQRQRRQLGMEKKMEEARASAQRSLQKLDSTLNTGVETLVELDRQGEQLRRARLRLDEMDDHMKESDHLLRGMGSWLGALYNKIAAPAPTPSSLSSSSLSSSSSKASPETSSSSSASSSSSSSSSSYWGIPSLFYSSSSSNSGSVAPKTTTSTVPSMLVDPEAKRFWEETDEHLDQMDERIERLHALARDMGGELEKQTREVEELDRKVQQANESIKERTLKIFRLT